MSWSRGGNKGACYWSFPSLFVPLAWQVLVIITGCLKKLCHEAAELPVISELSFAGFGGLTCVVSFLFDFLTSQ